MLEGVAYVGAYSQKLLGTGPNTITSGPKRPSNIKIATAKKNTSLLSHHHF